MAPCASRGARWVIGLVALVIVVAGLLVLRRPSPDARPRRGGFAITEGQLFGGSTGDLPPGSIGIFSMIYQTNAPITLHSIRPTRHDPGFVPVATRILLISALRQTGTTGMPGIICAPGPTMKGYGPTIEPQGVEVMRGEQIVTVFYFRIEREGPLKGGGTTFEYRIGDEIFTQTIDNTEWEAEGSRRAKPCPSDVAGIWDD